MNFPLLITFLVMFGVIFTVVGHVGRLQSQDRKKRTKTKR